MNNGFEITSSKNHVLSMTVIPGHFATSHSHINYYVDITKIKHRHMMAENAAVEFAKAYETTLVDTIVCVEGSEIIGSFLAKELSEANMMSMNSHKNINVITPEYSSNGQLIFYENLQPMVTGKNILLLFASITTGKALNRLIECIQYYGGQVTAVSAVFSATAESHGYPVSSIFTLDDIPGYASFSMTECPECQKGARLDAIVNSYGYTRL